MSKILAIKGSPEHGAEVIKVLEMLGGKNTSLSPTVGYNPLAAYSIYGDCHTIVMTSVTNAVKNNTFALYTITEFKEKFPFKVGDFVAIPEYESDVRITEMFWDGFEIHYVVYRNDEKEIYSAAELLDYNEVATDTSVDSNNCNYAQLGKTVAVCFNTENYESEVELQLGNYEIVNRNGKTFAVLKQPVYPKTFESCLGVLGIKEYEFRMSGLPFAYRNIERLARIIACRDAYWKLADNWKPNWDDQDWGDMYYISFDGKNLSLENGYPCCNMVLIFPTKEMRDAFFENFKEMIEECKELL
jgi:hypothetical protein